MCDLKFGIINIFIDEINNLNIEIENLKMKNFPNYNLFEIYKQSKVQNMVNPFH